MVQQTIMSISCLQIAKSCLLLTEIRLRACFFPLGTLTRNTKENPPRKEKKAISKHKQFILCFPNKMAIKIKNCSLDSFMNYDYHYAVTVEVMITLKIFYFSNVNGSTNYFVGLCSIIAFSTLCNTFLILYPKSCHSNIILLNFISKVLTQKIVKPILTNFISLISPYPLNCRATAFTIVYCQYNYIMVGSKR